MTKAHAPKKKKVPLRPPTEDPGRIIPGTDLLTAKLANQSAEVDIDTPLPRTDRGKISAGYNQAIGPNESGSTVSIYIRWCLLHKDYNEGCHKI
jgi:hypothetical protein